MVTIINLRALGYCKYRFRCVHYSRKNVYCTKDFYACGTYKVNERVKINNNLVRNKAQF